MQIRRHRRRHYRSALRYHTRYSTRLVGGATRPRRVDDVILFCRLYQRILKIDESLKPFLEEQFRLCEQHQHQQEIQAILQRVYGSKPQNQ